MNVFDKPDEQNEVYFNYAMARKRQFIEPLYLYERPAGPRPVGCMMDDVRWMMLLTTTVIFFYFFAAMS